MNVMTWAYKGLGDKNRLQVILWLQEITGGLQGLTGGHKSLQGVTISYRTLTTGKRGWREKKLTPILTRKYNTHSNSNSNSKS